MGSYMVAGVWSVAGVRLSAMYFVSKTVLVQEGAFMSRLVAGLLSAAVCLAGARDGSAKVVGMMG